MDRWALLQQMRVLMRREMTARPAAEGLPAGFCRADDVIVLLQPSRIVDAPGEHDALHSMLVRLAEKNFLTGTQAVGDDGLAAALLGACAGRGLGFHLDLSENEGADAGHALFGERVGCALVSTRPKAHIPLANFVERGGQLIAEAIGRVSDGDVRVRWMGESLVEIPRIEVSETNER